jgi:altronate dehydratase large subunit
MDSANPTVRRIADMVPTVQPVTIPYGRGQYGEDGDQTRRVLTGLGSNPNVAACVVVSLEPVSANDLAQAIGMTGKPVAAIAIQESGDTLRAAYDGAVVAARFVREASRQRRDVAPLSELTLGVECGGSDTTSGIASNPALGWVADRVVEAGGTVYLSETSEILGAEHVLARRAIDDSVHADIIRIVDAIEVEARRRGVDIRGANPVPDNIKGGITTIEEKSLGAILKAGTMPVRGVLRYGERATGDHGLYVMDTPAPAVESLTGLVSGGCQIIGFTTGVGNSIGASISPVVKISGNPNTVKRMQMAIDSDVSRVTLGLESLEDAGERLGQSILDYVQGSMTASEILGEQEIAISRLESTI